MLTQDIVKLTWQQMAIFSAEWHYDVPLRLHSRDLDESGSLQFSREFAQWIMRPDRYRLKRALQKLRKRSVREYEVVHRLMIDREEVAATTKWLNERSERNGKTDHYREKDTTVIAVCAVDKLKHWYFD